MRRILRPDAQFGWLTLDLTIAQLKTLLTVSRSGSTNLKDLASALEVTPANVTGIIDRLVERGLVSREENSSDRRMLVIKLTNEGKALLDGLSGVRVDYMVQALEKMDDDQLRSFSEGLAAFLTASEKVSQSHA